jgi:molecular chaperone HtpG
MDGQLDTPMVGMLEQKMEKCRFTRVDGDVIDRLIPKNDAPENQLDEGESANLSAIFRSQLPKLDKMEFHVEAQSMGEHASPILITQSEYMRRMKEMSRIQAGMSFYGEMPDMYTMVLNADHKLVKEILGDSKTTTEEALKPIEAELKGLNARHAALLQKQNQKKAEEVTQEEKDEVAQCDKDIAAQNSQKEQVLSTYAKDNKLVHQLIDLALLQNGMLKGEALNNFVKRSIDLIG